jgi:hypothetical protein
MKQTLILLCVVLSISIGITLLFQVETKKKLDSITTKSNVETAQEEPIKEDVSQQKVTKEDFCPVLEKYAEMFMEIHQNGGDLAHVYKFIGTLDLDEASKNMLRKILLHAAEYPTFSIEKNRQSTIMEFKNHWYFSCMKALK